MNEECQKAVISEMQVLLDGQKFTECEDYFKNENKAVKVNYNESAKQLELLVADVENGSVGEFSLADSWLFEEDQTAADATVAGTEFAETLRKQLGVKKEVKASNVALPTASGGAEEGISALTQKLLAVFPQYKETYRASVAADGHFYALKFYAAYFVPAITAYFEAENKKQQKKFVDMLAEMYVKTDSQTGDLIIAVTAAAIFNNERATAAFKEAGAEQQYIVKAVTDFCSLLNRDKKLREILLTK